jgi:type II secretory pathway pseudopilin PulG
MRKNLSAFTLFEVLIVIAILLATSIMVAPITLNQVQGNKLEASANQITIDIFLAQQYSYTSLNNSAYGIRFFTNSYVFFKGTDYATATEFEEFTLENVSITNADFGGSDDLLFPKGSLRPVNSGTITIATGLDSDVISINAEGLIAD